MLQEGFSWSKERQERWQKTRVKGCMNYVLKMAAIGLLCALAISLLYGLVTLAGGREFYLSTALTIPVFGALSGLIIGRAYWGLSESNFEAMNS